MVKILELQINRENIYAFYCKDDNKTAGLYENKPAVLFNRIKISLSNIGI